MLPKRRYGYFIDSIFCDRSKWNEKYHFGRISLWNLFMRTRLELLTNAMAIAHLTFILFCWRTPWEIFFWNIVYFTFTFIVATLSTARKVGASMRVWTRMAMRWWGRHWYFARIWNWNARLWTCDWHFVTWFSFRCRTITFSTYIRGFGLWSMRFIAFLCRLRPLAAFRSTLPNIRMFRTCFRKNLSTIKTEKIAIT